MSMHRKTSLLEFIVKYKGHHIVFWAAYHFIWWSVYSSSIAVVFESFSEFHNIVKYLGYVIFQAIGIYFCLYVLIPLYLEKHKFVEFFATLLLVLLLMSICITANYYVAGFIARESPYELFNIHPESPLVIFKRNAFPSCVAAITLGMSIKLAKNWQVSQKRQQELEKEKLETELKFLKSQFNPHFLFNTINSIFVLIDKNTEMASETLVKFSSLLRYQLYECNTSTISLRKELSYIESFMKLESLRQNEDFMLDTNYPEEVPEDLVIAPFILIPFIENAFKHLSHDTKGQKRVSVHASLKNDYLEFKVENSANFEENTKVINDGLYNGVGLKNVQRRLALIYKENFSLSTIKNDDTYAVQLHVPLLSNDTIGSKIVIA